VGVEYSEAAEVQEIAEELIPLHHPHLVDEVIVYVFRSEPATHKGREKAATARKITGLAAFLADRVREDGRRLEMRPPGEFFVVEVASPIWKEMGEAARRALVDHELEHCFVDEIKGKPSIRGHDVEEFTSIVERHGLWDDARIRFGKAVQLRLALSQAGSGVAPR
jgi:hypothetical protein